ncbi:hypothetical protein QZH41_017895 [Actinostola sp. cb2023]|nr:hypothetical protein QZH41_017895 [Actinostola sp. cb2023]
MADGVDAWFSSIVIFASLLKLLFLQTYRSTDFEVHRNWLAVTYSLPIDKWYYENTSQWTLDYPPLFAWFEFILSQVAVYVDPRMVVISSKEYVSTRTIVFQRVSVIVADLLLVHAAKEYCNYLHKTKKVSFPLSNGLILALLLVFNFGLLVGKHLEGAFLFSILLNFKHIFLYLAPAYFVYLLRTYCFISSGRNSERHILGVGLWDFSPVRLFKLGFFVICVFVVSFGPFIALGQLPQVVSRLFPFKRGLCHAYWAPNMWALYNVLDKAVAIVGHKLGWISHIQTKASMTGGLVGQTQHLILPSVSPLATVILTLISILPALLGTWYRPSGPRRFLQCLTLCAYGSFLFGWHVHEKAIIMITIPLCLLAVQHKSDARVFLLLSSAGHLSLFPLLFRPEETPIKVCLMLMYSVLAFYSLCLVHCGKSSGTTTLADILTLPIVTSYEAVYVCGLAILEIYNCVIHPFTPIASTFPFLPLMLTSVYCAIGVVWSWLLFYRNFFSYGEVTLVKQPEKNIAKKKKR